jgi:ABC-2 type transport system permease protein
VRTLLKAKLWMLKNWVVHMTYTDAVQTLGFGLLGAAFLGTLYYGFIRLLWEVKNVELIGGLLIVKLMSMAFLTTFVMIVFSSTLASFTTLFFARDLAFLMHSPAPFRSVFFFKSLETSFFASWMVVLAMLPFLGAYGMVHGLGAGFYATLAALSVPFVLTACAVGIFVSLSLMCVFPSRRVREIMLLVGILAGSGLYILFRWLEPEKLVRADSFEVVIQYIALLEAPLAPYLPSWWMTSAVTAYAAERAAGLAGHAALLSGVALTALAALAVFAEKAYYNGWTSAQESARRKTRGELGSEWRWAPRFLGQRLRALLGKDALLFVRDSNQWSQLLLLLALVAVYLISIDKLPLDTPYIKGLISFLNIGMVGFVLASVALRFVFPSVSLEGKFWWSIRSAPLSLWTVLGEKFLAGFLPLAAMGVTLVWLSNRFLGVDTFVVWLSNVTIFVMALTLCAMGVGFGALFPRFGVENIPQIETSPGGLLYMVCAMFYIGLTLAFEAVLMRMHYFSLVREGYQWRLDAAAWAVGALLALNLAAGLAPFALGRRRLETADV